ncbi:MAG: tetratricopeptide repeat protein [Mucilaginibacter sp.]
MITLAQSTQTVNCYNQLGKEAILRNDSVAAIANFDKAMALDSTNKIAHVGYALTHHNARAYDILTDLLNIAPEDTSLYIVRAYCSLNIEKKCKQAGNFNEAGRWFGRAVIDYQWLIAHNTHLNLAQAHLDEAEAIWNGSYAPARKITEAPVNSVNNVVSNSQPMMPVTGVTLPQLIIGNGIDHTGLNKFMAERLQYSAIGKPVYTKLSNGDVKVKYQFRGPKPESESLTVISITYTLSVNNAGAIKKVSISGNRTAIEQLFVSYWPASTTLNDIKQRRTVSYQFLTDKITYTGYNPAMASISVTKKL